MTNKSPDQPSERDLLWAALDLPPERREKFLLEASEGDTARLDRLLALVENAEAKSQFMDQPAVALDLTTAMSSDLVGTKIGRYKLMEQVGEGGMGIVYVAEQSEPVRRTVALKLIKPGMDTKQVIARFEAERQALALMDHPNIARVIDAGTTDRGLPYFVMELVRGLPITEYCDKAKLSPKDRLQLFTTVCSAVQHAHLKGIIHRDLKPNNILVTLHDGVPVVKVIDFGVAKALHQQLTQHTIYTALHQVVGTPLYMSPEQLELSGLDVDTRTDIYSLGVLLYELLTGVLPFDRDELYKSGFDEMRRIIREQDPPRPSQRITTLDEKSKSTHATRRGLDNRSFAKMVRGELDWIVMKALEKDRDRRYESASTMASDVLRYLNDEPILACPPSSLYQWRKFVYRNRSAVAAITVVFLSLLSGIAMAGVGLVRANIERQKAESNAKAAMNAEIAAINALKAGTNDAIKLLIGSKDSLGPQETAYIELTLKRWEEFARNNDGADQRIAIQAEGFFQIGELYEFLGRNKEARLNFSRSVELRNTLERIEKNNPRLQRELGKSLHKLMVQHLLLGEADEAKEANAKALAIQAHLVQLHPGNTEFELDLVKTRNWKGELLQGEEKFTQAEECKKTAIETCERLITSVPRSIELLETQANIEGGIGTLYNKMDMPLESLAHHEKAKNVILELTALSPNSVDYKVALCQHRSNQASVYQKLKQFENAEREFLACLDVYQGLANQFPANATYRARVAKTHLNLDITLGNQRKTDAATRHSIAANEIYETLAKEFPENPDYRDNLILTWNRLAGHQTATKQFSEALVLYQKALAYLDALSKSSSPSSSFNRQIADNKASLGDCYLEMDRLVDARREWEETLRIRQVIAKQSPSATSQGDVSSVHHSLGVLMQRQKEMPQAISSFEQALEAQMKIVREYPNLPAHQARAARYCQSLAIALGRQGQNEEAQRHYLTAIQILEKLVERLPKVEEYQLSLSRMYVNYGGLQTNNDLANEGLPFLTKAVALLERFPSNSANYDRSQPMLIDALDSRARTLATLKRFDEAIQDIKKAMSLGASEKKQRSLKWLLAAVSIDSGDIDAGIDMLHKLAANQDRIGEHSYDIACGYAKAAKACEDKREGLMNLAMENFRRAIDEGFEDINRINKSESLDILRGRPDFVELMMGLHNAKSGANE